MSHISRSYQLPYSIECWEYLPRSTLQILLSEIDDDDNSEELLKLKEEEGMYPPTINLVISSTLTAKQSQTKIQFRGALKEDIPLNPLQSSLTTGIMS